VIRVATVFAEGIFEGETLVMYPKEEEVSQLLNIQLMPPKDTPLDIHIRVSISCISIT
jgi:Bardet-Biedl syndrome 2 protein